MTAKILCQRHNQALSPPDAEAAHFFSTLRDFDWDLRDAAESETTEVTADGAKLERWMLKLLAGVVYGGLSNSSALRRGSPWLQILFGLEEWPPGWGLHIVTSDETVYGFDGLDFITYTVEDEVWAAKIGVAGPNFYLSLGAPDDNPALRRRPSELVFTRPDRNAFKRLTLEWPSGPDSDWVEFSREADYDGPRPQDREYKEI